MPDNPIILDIQGEDGFTLDMQDSDGLDFEAQPFSKGDPGKSAYQVAVDNGFSGTEEEWLASLVGPQGPPGTTDWDGITNKPSINGVTLGGSQTSADLGIVTTPDWNEDDSTALDYIQNRPNVRVGTSANGTSIVIGDLDENTASGNYSISAGRNNHVEKNYAVAIGRNNTINGNAAYSFASGWDNAVAGNCSAAIGDQNSAGGVAAFAAGSSSHAEAQCAAAIGQGNTASGIASFAEAYHTRATEQAAHAEGHSTIASGLASHAEGHTTTASGNVSHAEGWETVASGYVTHAEGHGTQATARYNHVFGEYNISDPGFTAANARGTYIEIVGNGSDAQNRSNARTLDWSGNEVLAGKLTVGAGPTANMDVATKQYVDNAVLNAAVNANECLTFWHASDVI